MKVNREFKEALLFVAPLVIFISFFILLPICGTFWTSLWQDVAFISKKFIGLENYVRLLSDRHFWQSTYFTLLFPLISVSLEMFFGMIFALVLNETFRFRGILRGISLIPWAIPSIVGARIWQLIYRYDYGLANLFLKMFGIQSINWLGSPVGAFSALVLADVWRTTPFVAIILLAGLQTVPNDIYDQAQVDGSNFVQRFFKITLPLIKPIVIIALLFRTIDAIRVFDLIYVITEGGPGGVTTSLSLYGYKFFLLGDFGYGSTVSVILFLISFIIALTYIKVGRIRTSIL
ncbi:ABC transporter permease [candidate division TA06 bacterium DG_78]|uniref:ABC transporter permease n=1 Tax=candidate division TA06 bacterium DG_78 TaxID=1703772 RepID=A0A0S7YH96_UNCT6|nr:MAG: ABC transporter permease [candidate division TA06 bacterium DG_78]